LRRFLRVTHGLRRRRAPPVHIVDSLGVGIFTYLYACEV
jgi:hypothetical protein